MENGGKWKGECRMYAANGATSVAGLIENGFSRFGLFIGLQIQLTRTVDGASLETVGSIFVILNFLNRQCRFEPSCGILSSA